MIYRCSNKECDYITEQDEAPARCIVCGSTVEEKQEQELDGREWSLLGVYWLRQGSDGERAVYCFRQAASKGNAWGICNLGWCMESGIGESRDYRQAAWLYEQAAELGYVPAICNLGVFYEEGLGVPKDEEKAAQLYREAADTGFPRAHQKPH